MPKELLEEASKIFPEGKLKKNKVKLLEGRTYTEEFLEELTEEFSTDFMEEITEKLLV